MKLSLVFILAITPLLSSCQSMINYAMTSSPSDAAAAIIETDKEKDISNCQLLGDVEGSSMLGRDGDGDVSVSVNNAMVDAKENAAKLGATHMLISKFYKTKSAEPTLSDVMNGEGGGSSIKAKAYKCMG